MIDRLVEKGLASPRAVVGRPAGGAGGDHRRRAGVLAEIAGPLAECHQRQLGHLSAADLKRLSELLREARRPHEPDGSVWR